MQIYLTLVRIYCSSMRSAGRTSRELAAVQNIGYSSHFPYDYSALPFGYAIGNARAYIHIYTTRCVRCSRSAVCIDLLPAPTFAKVGCKVTPLLLATLLTLLRLQHFPYVRVFYARVYVCMSAQPCVYASLCMYTTRVLLALSKAPLFIRLRTAFSYLVCVLSPMPCHGIKQYTRCNLSPCSVDYTGAERLTHALALATSCSVCSWSIFYEYVCRGFFQRHHHLLAPPWESACERRCIVSVREPNPSCPIPILLCSSIGNLSVFCLLN